MDMSWTQLFVRHEGGPLMTKQILTHIEPHLMRFGALPCKPDNEILLQSDGTGEIRIYGGGLPIVERLLKDSELEIVNKIVHKESKDDS